MTVEGNLDLTGRHGLTRLPEDLTVKGYMSCSGCLNLKRLPTNLRVNGSLSLLGCKRLESMEPVAVGGGVYVDVDLIKRTPQEILPLLIGMNFHNSNGVSISQLIERLLRGETE